ncbi:MAG: DUF2911 domain-containing protein [Bryobacteraceae bacterium]
MTRSLSCFTIAALAAGTLCLQAGVRKVTPNAKSPATSTSMKLGGHDVLIEYSAPSARGREVEGGLIPYDQVWRAGADSATTLSNDADIMIGDLRVPKGVHTLYVAASPTEWKLVVNKQTGQWGTEYNESQDLGRVSLKLTKASAPIETFKIALSGGMLSLEWGHTIAKVPLKLAQ